MELQVLDNYNFPGQLVPPRDKKEPRGSYIARENACVAAWHAVESTSAALDTFTQRTRSNNLELKLKIVDACAAVYQKTIDEKAADITTREAELIKECRSLDSYPPHQ
jgi:hypothetical protein